MLSLYDFTFLSFRPGTSLGRGNSFESKIPNRDALPLSLVPTSIAYLLKYSNNKTESAKCSACYYYRKYGHKNQIVVISAKNE